MFNLYQYHSRQYVEDLRKTLKGKVEHRIFALFLTARSTEDMDKYFYRLLDVRFERKKCEAIALAKRKQEERRIAEEYDQMEHDWETKYNRVSFARSHMQKAIHHLSRIDHPLIAELEALKAKLY